METRIYVIHAIRNDLREADEPKTYIFGYAYRSIDAATDAIKYEDPAFVWDTDPMETDGIYTLLGEGNGLFGRYQLYQVYIQD
jgi:hypothetical protein